MEHIEDDDEDGGGGMDMDDEEEEKVCSWKWVHFLPEEHQDYIYGLKNI